MGSLKKFVAWLSGEKPLPGKSSKPVDPVKTTAMSMRIFLRRLERQIKRMEIQSKRARAKAIERRKAGDLEGSKLHMKSALQFRKWANATENFKVRLEGLNFKLQQAQAIQDFSGIAKDMAKVLKSIQTQIKIPEISQLLNELDLGFGKVDALMEEVGSSLEASESASSTAVSDEEVEEALAEIDTELKLDTQMALPSIPGGTSAQTVDEKEIKDLEEEINKLKQGRV